MQVGNNPSGVKDFLYTYETQGASGKVKFDKFGDRVGVEFDLMTISKGERSVVGEVSR